MALAGHVPELHVGAHHNLSIVDRINAVPGLKTSAVFLALLRANLVLDPTATAADAAGESSSSPPSSAVAGSLWTAHSRSASSAAFSSSSTSSGSGTSDTSPFPIPTREAGQRQADLPSPRSESGLKSSFSFSSSSSSSLSPSSLAAAAVPPTIWQGPLTARADRVAALRLVSSSVLDQRHDAFAALTRHPLSILVLTAAEILLAWRVAWCRLRSPVLALAIACALGVAYALAARWVVGGYARIAEMIGREEWLVNPMALRVSGSGSGNGPVATAEDVIVGTRVGDDIVGALVLRLEPSPAAMALAAASAAGPGGGGSGSGSGGGPMSVSGGCGNVITGGGGGEGGRRRRGGSRHGSVAGLKGGRGLVRAWTVHPHYRHRGLGSDLLHEAVRFTRERCGRDAEVGFAREHAHSRMVLPELFNRGFRRRERMAAWALRDVLAEWDMTRRKR